MRLKKALIFLTIVFRIGGISCSTQFENSEVTGLYEVSEPVELLTHNLKNKKSQNLSVIIDEIPCYGRNRMEIEMTDLGKTIKAQIHYGRDDESMFRDTVIDNKAELILEMKKILKDDYNKTFIDTIVVINKQGFLTSLKNCKGLDDYAQVAGYSSIIRIEIDNKQTEYTSFNSRLLGLFKSISY